MLHDCLVGSLPGVRLRCEGVGVWLVVACVCAGSCDVL